MEADSSGIGARKRRSTTDVEPAEMPDVGAVLDQVISGPGHDDRGAGGLPDKNEFQLEFTDSRGHQWKGAFRHHVLSSKELTQVGLTRARLSGGIPPTSLDPLTNDLLEMRAHLAVALDEAPEWARDLGSIRGHGLLSAIYGEVASYEARFWGADRTTGRDGSGG